MMKSVGLMHSHTLIPGLPPNPLAAEVFSSSLMRAGASYHLSMLQRPPLIRQYIHHSLTRGPPPLSFPHVQQMRSNQNITQDLTLEIVVRNMK